MIPPGVKAVVIGASAGALDALTSILPSLPVDYPIPVMIVVHLPPDRPSIIAGLLNAKCQIMVKEAEDKEAILAGFAYVAPPNYHLLIEQDGRLSLSNEEPVNYSRPSVDVLFETAADAYGEELLAIVLTGANEDGARGAAKVSELGGRVIVQDPSTAQASAMPLAALSACVGAEALSLAAIADSLRFATWSKGTSR